MFGAACRRDPDRVRIYTGGMRYADGGGLNRLSGPSR